MAESHSTRITISDLDGLRDKIVTLRCQGHGIETIAKTLGVTYKTVKTAIETEFRERFANREELKLQTALQFDWLVRPLMEKFESSGDRRDAEIIVKILDRKARLLGLDEPVKVEVKQVESLSDDELEKELARHGVVKPINPAPPALPATTPPVEEPIVDAEYKKIEEQPLLKNELEDDNS